MAKSRICASALIIIIGSLLPARVSSVLAQSTGRIEFTAHVAPSGGRPEPVRQMTFCLLRKSLEDIRLEALETAPAPSVGKFIDGLSVSPELKAWMKKHDTVQLSGGDFTKSLSGSDIVDVPEFFNAYMERNLGYKGVSFPTPKFKEKDRASNPEKYEQAKEEYKAAIRKFVASVPESVQGIDVDLADLNPYTKWQTLVHNQERLLETRINELAQGRYLAAQTDTNLDGHGAFAGIAPGNYWVALVAQEAISGDVRLHWDFPVTVHGGETTYVELSNLNAAKPAATAQNSNN